MTLRKITIDNSVRYIPKSEQNKIKNKKQSEQIQPISGGGKANPRKQNRNISQSSKKLLNKVAASGFVDLK